MVETLVRRLEMTRPQQLRPGRHVPGLEVVRATDPAGADTARIRALHKAIATPHYWSSLGRSNEQWQEFLSAPDRLHYIATANGRDIGWASLHIIGAREVQIRFFGIRPDAVGRGHGGAFLTEVVRKAWRLLGDMDAASGCVWLTTTSWDHPHALANYLARGFRVARLELRQQTGADGRHTALVDEPPQYLVRPAVAADARPVTALIEDLGYPLPVEPVQQRLQRFASSSDDVVAVVVEQLDRVVGVVSAHIVPWLSKSDPGFVRITALSVAPRARKQGVGRRLVEFVEYVARTRGISLLEVTSGRRPERETAHRFYASLGFQDSAPSQARYWKRLDPEH